MTRFLGQRLFIVSALTVVLALMFAPLVRAFVDQRAALHSVESELESNKQRLTELDAEKERWEDPAYVRQQARERLMFVEPGDVPYIVVDGTGDSAPPSLEPLPGTTLFTPKKTKTPSATETSTESATSSSTKKSTKSPSPSSTASSKKTSTSKATASKTKTSTKSATKTSTATKTKTSTATKTKTSAAKATTSSAPPAAGG